MTLSALIHKNKTERVRTLTVATIATQTQQTSPIVANSDIEKVVICDKADIQPLTASPKPVSEVTQWNHDAALMALIQKSNLTQLTTMTVATSAALKSETVVNPEIQNLVIVEMPDSQPIELKLEQVSDAVFFADDRRHCSTCGNLSAGRCLAAWRGEIVAAKQYRPIDDLPRRCEGFAPKLNDPDQRTGKQRLSWVAGVKTNG
jgi:hypothetical protein